MYEFGLFITLNLHDISVKQIFFYAGKYIWNKQHNSILNYYVVLLIRKQWYFNVSVCENDWSWDKSYIHKKIYWCYFDEGVWVSLHEKARCNIRIYHKTRIYLQDIKTHLVYLKGNWFNLKNCTGTHFGICRLYYKN